MEKDVRGLSLPIRFSWTGDLKKPVTIYVFSIIGIYFGMERAISTNVILKFFGFFFNHALSKDVLCQVLYDIGWINCYREEDDGNVREQFTTILIMTILPPTTENFQSEL